MAENIYELFPLFPHHIFYPAHLRVVQNKSSREGRVERGAGSNERTEGAVKGLGRCCSRLLGFPGLRLAGV